MNDHMWMLPDPCGGLIWIQNYKYQKPKVHYKVGEFMQKFCNCFLKKKYYRTKYSEKLHYEPL